MNNITSQENQKFKPVIYIKILKYSLISTLIDLGGGGTNQGFFILKARVKKSVTFEKSLHRQLDLFSWKRKKTLRMYML